MTAATAEVITSITILVLSAICCAIFVRWDRKTEEKLKAQLDAEIEEIRLRNTNRNLAGRPNNR